MQPIWILIKKILSPKIINFIKKNLRPLIFKTLIANKINFNPIDRNIFLKHNFKNYIINFQKNIDILMVSAFTTDRVDILKDIIEESFNSQLNICWLIVGSTDEDLKFINSLKIKYPNRVSGLLEKNIPLGKKWQSVIFASESLDYNLLGITGSDDLIFYKTYDNVFKRFKNLNKNSYGSSNIGLYCFNDWYVLSKNNLINAQYYNNSYQPVGAGRFYSKQFLEHIKYELFDIEIDKLLDDKGFCQLSRNGYYYDLLNTNEDGGFVSIKQGSEINSYLAISNSDNILVNKNKPDFIKTIYNNITEKNFSKYINLVNDYRYLKNSNISISKLQQDEFFY